jgi:hypothetical protein
MYNPMAKALDLAQHYFALSNERRLDDIEAMLAPSTTYSSANTGLYLGASPIMAMQRAFFAGFEELGWTAHDVEEVSPGIVRFDFTFEGTTRDGEQIRRDGIEHIVVFEDRIQHVDVR